MDPKAFSPTTEALGADGCGRRSRVGPVYAGAMQDSKTLERPPVEVELAFKEPLRHRFPSFIVSRKSLR